MFLLNTSLDSIWISPTSQRSVVVILFNLVTDLIQKGHSPLSEEWHDTWEWMKFPVYKRVRKAWSSDVFGLYPIGVKEFNINKKVSGDGNQR